jgi:osmotically-inducible protein OsmY
MRAVMTHMTVAVVLVAAGACSKENDKSTRTPLNQPPSQDQQAAQAQQVITAAPQSGTALDRTLEETVHREIIGRQGLSNEAKSVQINVQDGVVTLQGPVASLQEKSHVESIAGQVHGVMSVDNQLEVVSR